MDRITKITPILYETNHEGQPAIERHEIKRFRKMSSLLSESLRFYNYGANNNSRLIVKSSNWRVIDGTSILKGITELQGALHKIHLSMFRTIALNNSSGKKLQQYIHPDVLKTFQPKNSAHRGIFGAKVFVSPEFRRSAAIDKLFKPSQNPRKIDIRPYDLLCKKLLKLRKQCQKSRLEESLSIQFVAATDPTCDPSLNPVLGDQFYFQPFWGGPYIVLPKEPHQTETFWPHKDKEVGPTEKLYYCLCSSLFTNVHGKKNASKRTVESVLRNFNGKFHGSLDDAIFIVTRILPYIHTEKKTLKRWISWLDNLNYLEFIFGQAILLNKELAGVKNPGIHLGLPAAIGLVRILRAYLTDILAQTLMVSLPLSIKDIYHTISGYMGVAFWEALSNKSIPNLTEPGCLSQRTEKTLSGSLKQWRAFSTDNLFWSLNEPVNYEASNKSKEILKQPLIQEKLKISQPRPKKGPKVQASAIRNISFNDFPNEVPRYPPVTEDFFSASGYKPTYIPDPKLSGARFFAQLHVFVATQLLAKGLTVLQLPPSDDTKFRRKCKNFDMGAGSNLWNGRKYPHQTHRNGGCFDLSFGPNLPCWPLADSNETIESLSKSDAGKAFLREKDPTSKIQRLKLYKQALVASYSHKESERIASDKGQHHFFLFRRLFIRPIFDAFQHVYDVYEKTLKGEDLELEGPDFEMSLLAEQDAYQVALESLLGTPHFIDSDQAELAFGKIPEDELTNQQDWQRSHIAHVAILLSVPANIVYASPIHHLRAMHAIRQAFRNQPVYEGALLSAGTTIQLGDNVSRIKDAYKGMQVVLMGGDGKGQRRMIVSYDPLSKAILIGKDWAVAPNAGDPFQIIDTPDYQLVTELVRSVFFSFLPHNHHHHWHVDYKIPWNRSLSERCKRSWFLSPVARIRYFLPIWLDLGINLTPFIAYLKQYKLLNTSAPNVKKALSEYQAVLNMCINYQNSYISRYGKHGKPVEWAIENANSLVKAIFHQYKKDEALIKPTITAKHIEGAYTDKVMKEVRKASFDIQMRELEIMKKQLYAQEKAGLYQASLLKAVVLLPEESDDKLGRHEVDQDVWGYLGPD
jgi:hypothetical protein